MTGKQVAGLILLIFGGFALLGMLGIQVGGLIRLGIGIVLIIYGVKKWKQDRPIWAGVVAVFGALFILGSVHVVISVLIGGLLIYFGWKMMKSNSGDGSTSEPPTGNKPPKDKLSDPFDEEWERLMKSAQT